MSSGQPTPQVFPSNDLAPQISTSPATPPINHEDGFKGDTSREKDQKAQEDGSRGGEVEYFETGRVSKSQSMPIPGLLVTRKIRLTLIPQMVTKMKTWFRSVYKKMLHERGQHKVKELVTECQDSFRIATAEKCHERKHHISGDKPPAPVNPQDEKLASFPEDLGSAPIGDDTNIQDISSSDSVLSLLSTDSTLNVNSTNINEGPSYSFNIDSPSFYQQWPSHVLFGSPFNTITDHHMDGSGDMTPKQDRATLAPLVQDPSLGLLDFSVEFGEDFKFSALPYDQSLAETFFDCSTFFTNPIQGCSELLDLDHFDPCHDLGLEGEESLLDPDEVSQEFL